MNKPAATWTGAYNKFMTEATSMPCGDFPHYERTTSPSLLWPAMWGIINFDWPGLISVMRCLVPHFSYGQTIILSSTCSSVSWSLYYLCWQRVSSICDNSNITAFRMWILLAFSGSQFGIKIKSSSHPFLRFKSLSKRGTRDNVRTKQGVLITPSNTEFW